MTESHIQMAYNYVFYAPAAASESFSQGFVTVETKTIHVVRSKRFPKLLLSLGLTCLIVYFTPLAISSVIIGSDSLETDAETRRLMESLQNQAVENYLPPLDTSLPLGTYITISNIGVNSSIYEQDSASYEEALKKGPWRVPEYSTPDKQGVPTIIAAHRFGYIAWSNKFRREHSFFNLPKLKTGDTVEIIWNQRKYTYGIYAQSQGATIVDYSADLILYTCNDLSSDQRIIMYAKLLRV